MKTNPIVESDLHTIIEGLGKDLYRFEGKKVLISGACGFLGSWFIAVFEYCNQRLFKEPVTVYAIDSFIATDSNNNIVEVKSPYIQFIKADISRFPFFPHDKIDFIIHAAGIASPIYYRKFPIETIEGMAMGLYKLLQYATDNPVEGFLYFSSSEAYGNPDQDNVPMYETYNGNVSTLGPRSCYDESKRFGETMSMIWQQQKGIPVTMVRPFNVYGPGMRVKDDRVVPKFIFQILRGEPLTVHVPGTQTRTFCYITDAMIGFFKVLLLGKPGEVYNIGQDNPEIGMIELAEQMKQMFGINKVKIKEVEMPQEYPTDQAQRRLPSISKAKEYLGYYPSISLNQGLRRSFEWCQYALEAWNETQPKPVQVDNPPTSKGIK